MEEIKQAKLDLNDWKILNQLDLNCRQSDAEIGKKTRISKQVVNYRIKKLLDENIISAFFLHINTAKLGCGAHKVYIKFKALPKSKELELWSFLAKQPKVVWVISCSGKWDLIFGIVSKDLEGFDKTFDEFMNRYSKYISTRAISVFNKATLHHRKWLLNKNEDISWLLGGKIEDPYIDEIDKRILLELDKNARTPVIEISEKLKTSSSLIIQRMKKLQEKGVIGAFRTALNLKKLKMHYCKSFIYYQNKTTESEEELLSYIDSLSGIIGVAKSIGPWDLELEFEVSSYDEFHTIMKEMKNKFEIIDNFDTVYIDNEYMNLASFIQS